MGTAENSVNYHRTVKWTAVKFGCFCKKKIKIKFSVVGGIDKVK